MCNFHHAHDDAHVLHDRDDARAPRGRDRDDAHAPRGHDHGDVHAPHGRGHDDAHAHVLKLPLLHAALREVLLPESPVPPLLLRSARL